MSPRQPADDPAPTGDGPGPTDRAAPSRDPAPYGSPPAQQGSTTPHHGTPVAVDVSRDRQNRITWVVFLAGPVIWFAHFAVVYLAAEAGCTGAGPGLEVFDPPVPVVLTIVATVVAAIACLATATWAYARWRPAPGAREDDGDRLPGGRGGALTYAGLLLALLSFLAVLFVGVSAFFLQPC